MTTQKEPARLHLRAVFEQQHADRTRLNEAEKELADWRTLLSHYDELIQSAHYHTNHFQNCQGRLVRRLEQSVMPDCADWCTVRRTNCISVHW